MGSITAVRGGRRIALAAIRRSLPCSAGVRFLPGLKAGASSEEPGDVARPVVDQRMPLHDRVAGKARYRPFAAQRDTKSSDSVSRGGGCHRDDPDTAVAPAMNGSS
ncbi:hypothetical protein GCM10022206_46030 [Streptomyces chiangmaiensis]